MLSFEPCVPDDLEEYSIRYEYKSSVYNIRIRNLYKTNEVKKFLVNGEEIKEKQIKLIDNGRIYEVEVEI